MSDFLVALGILILLGVGVTLVRRRGSLERRRARSERAAAAKHAPMSAEEEEHAAAIHEIVQEARTGDLPRYRDPAGTNAVREALRRYRRPGKHSAARRLPKSKPATTALDGPTPARLEQAVMLPGPTPALDLETFSGTWSRAELDAILARGKAGAR